MMGGRRRAWHLSPCCFPLPLSKTCCLLGEGERGWGSCTLQGPSELALGKKV